MKQIWYRIKLWWYVDFYIIEAENAALKAELKYYKGQYALNEMSRLWQRIKGDP